MTTEVQSDLEAGGPGPPIPPGFVGVVALGVTGSAVIAIAGLLAYIPGLRVLGSIRSDYIPMAPSTAACFLILSAAIFRYVRKPRQDTGLMAVAALVFLVILFSLLDVAGSFAGMDLSFEDRLVPQAGTIGGIPIARMSPATGTAFIMAGLGAFLLLLRLLNSSNGRRLGHWASSLGVLTILFGATVLLSYLYGSPLLYGSTNVPMAATTAMAFLFLGAGLAAASGRESFPLRLATGASTSARLSRAFIPLTVAVVLIQSILSQFVPAPSLVSGALFLAVLVIVTVTVTGTVVARVAHTIGNNLDELQRKLRESEKQHRVLVENLPVGLYSSTPDPEGRFIMANPFMARMFGYTSVEEFLNISMKDLYQNPVDCRGVAEKILTQGSVQGEEVRLRKKDGTLIWGSVTAQAIRDAEGNMGCFDGFIKNITERKRSEAVNAKLEEQLQQAQKMESIGRLAGGVAHDFNNMLGVILGHTELAMEQVDPAHPLFEDLSEVRKAAERSADLTRQLLAFARKQTVAPKVLDLNETVEGMLKMLRRLIGENIDLAWLPGPGLWPVKVDPSQIDQILANLCVNVRDAIAGVGKVTIETENMAFDEDYCREHAGFVPGEYVLLAVSDDGIGMDKETLSHIFEPFFTTKGVGEGTGLGLATVYGIVRQNNGFINVYSEPGKGTTFRIYLTRFAEGALPAQPKGPAEPDPRGHETILVVEDEPAILKMTLKMLERQGYIVLPAGSPGEAIRLAEQHTGEIHLLMTDVVMPEMNGRDLAKNLMSRHPGLKSLFMSGYTANAIAHHGVLDEGVQFIQKPFSIKDLAAKIREALGKNDE